MGLVLGWGRRRGPAIALRKGPLLFGATLPATRGRTLGAVHYAFEVAQDRLGDAVGHVGACLEVYGPVNPDWMDAISYHGDPDANLIEVVLERPMSIFTP